MKVVLFGATGMIGAGALLECLDAAVVQSVLVVGRSRCGVTHHKLTEVILDDVAKFGYPSRILESRDINKAAAGMGTE